MRNFEERKAEIFRRSEARIQKRRQSRKMITLCVLPVLICVTVGSAMLFPALIPTKSEMGSSGFVNNATPEMAGNDGAGRPAACPYTAAVISSFRDGRSWRISDPIALADIAALLSADLSDFGPAAPNGPVGAEEGYWITLVAPDGSESVYSLVGSTLTDTAAGSAWSLDDHRLSQLQELLGLPE